ncbi:copper chaperone PCu(A)C [Paracoccus ravus]|uniref:copper chaperone PCu(A)C n=1 Tax=Paracoccus ravus TaxID=2447760 RepID=UPI00106EA98F|nr:copper chaperone PCu(A)C [Paracoccus ravus]
MTLKFLAAPILGAIFLGSFGSSAIAEPAAAAPLTITQPHIRAMPPQAPVAGGYAIIANTGAQDDRLISASSPRAGEVQIHEMTMNGNVMKMRELPEGLPIPAGETVALKPGGYHLMFLGVTQPYAEGETVPATLVFEKAGSIDLDFEVRPMRAAPAAGHGHASGHAGH